MRQIPSFCPKCGWQYVAEVCGGDFPYWRRMVEPDGKTIDPEPDCMPNVYFELDLETEQPVKAAADWEGLDLGEFDDLDYKEMLEHAQNNGCIGEPICITCGQPLVWEYKGMNQIETSDLQEWYIKKLPNGNFKDNYDSEFPQEFTPKEIGQDLLDDLRKLVPGSYIIQIWTKEHYEREFDLIQELSNKEHGNEQQSNTK